MVIPNDVIGEAYTNSLSWDVLEQLADLDNRMPGQTGERDAAEIIVDLFKEIGLNNIKMDEFEIPGWSRNNSSLSVSNPYKKTFSADHEIITLPGTPADNVKAEVVNLGYALPPDFENQDVDGKLVLATASSGNPESYHRPLHRSEKYRLAAEAGAAGFLFYSGLEGCLPPTGWAVFERPEETPGPIPGVGVSHELGQKLIRWTSSNKVTATLNSECENNQAVSQNVEAVVGPDTEQEILISAHADAHDLGSGARDNGAGVAIALEIGRLLKYMDGQLDTRVRIVIFGSEEVGLNGSNHWVDTHDTEDIKCILNLDGIGGSRDLEILTHGFNNFKNVLDPVSSEFNTEIEINDGMHVFSDQWPFVQQGIPGVACRSVPEEDNRRWGLGRLWSHTHADTMDKLDPRDLRDLAVLLTATTTQVANKQWGIDHKSPEEVRMDVPKSSEEEMRYNGRWPWN
jgi:Zn-dependent M28 family amino/carboxypeptidase